ncbi:MAG TPA: glycoside hydrolase family 2 [Planctomycetes bacterium]|nr:glycoside hydrolase family 2 [Planctomycetota bacterium]HIJ69844.1 glycoside hydrolase family 2 [Planctomycetota bacterium]
MKKVRLETVLFFVTILGACGPVEHTPEQAGEIMMTRWAKEVSPENVLAEYPRPMMVRDQWLNLNGLWEYAITGKDEEMPKQFDGKILVPFPVESELSGVAKKVTESERLWYKRKFELPALWKGRRFLLHFGAVDWETVVYVNGGHVGTHHGGYDPFTFDITGMLNSEGLQEITIAVWDPTDEGHQPRGKQTLEPRGFWYTAVTGIWQTVWLEPVPDRYIRRLVVTPDIDSETVDIFARTGGKGRGGRIEVVAKEGKQEVARAEGTVYNSVKLKIPAAKLWSPDSPFLYELEVVLTKDGQVIDEVSSYFGMRKISRVRDRKGVLRLALNDKIGFQYGTLDQGWWPDGLYRAPTDEALRYDIEITKKLGFNTIRKHIKVEPQRFYYWCDKLGILVWQDMVSGDVTGEWGTERTEESARQFELELVRMMVGLRNHPSIVVWVLFNEGWGQYDTDRLVEWMKKKDRSRLVIGASGFVDKGVGDIHDVHGYPGPTGAPAEKGRALVLGEFGGLGLPVEGHTWQEKKSWGYRGFKDAGALALAYEALLEELKPYISLGLSAAVYTQITDVENEVNGLMTYDRAVVKMDSKRLATAAEELCRVGPDSYKFEPVVPTSQEESQQWRYTIDKPPEGWRELDFEDSSWQQGAAGFGDPDVVGAIVRTKWTGNDIWLRKTFALSGKDISNPYLIVYHDFEQETLIYLNGELVAEGPEHQFAYTLFRLEGEAKSRLREGENILAVHGRRLGRRQYIDAGLLDLTD